MHSSQSFCRVCTVVQEKHVSGRTVLSNERSEQNTIRRHPIMKKALVFLCILMLTGIVAGSCAEQAAASLPEPGSILRFGHYEQDNHTDNGPEEIEWLVLDHLNGKILLISLYALDTKPYNEVYGEITWEECSLRRWLNDTFFSAAFSKEEQQAVVLNHTDNGPSQCCSKYATTGGNDTLDRVFLLSYTEADRYFENDTARQCTPTSYALARGAHNVRHAGKLCGLWWFRSPGNEQYRVSCSYSGGMLNYTYASKKIGCVRPVILLDPALLPGSVKE